MGRVRLSSLLLVALCASAVARVRAADSPSLERALPPARAAHAGVDAMLTTSPSGPTVSSLGGALRLAGDYRFPNGLGVSLEGGIASVSLDVERQRTRSGTFPGNLLLGLFFERRLRPQLELGANFRVGAPFALYPGGIDDNRLADLAYSMAASAQGFREPLIWQMNVVPVTLGAQATLQALDWLTLTGQLAPSYLISVNQRPSRVTVTSHVDAAATLQSLVVHVGVTHFVSALALENRHLDQLALRCGAGAVVSGQRWMLDLSIGLDAPYGAFESAPHPWWGVGIVTDLQFGAGR